jgi:PAS domain-containing protein
VGDKKVENYSKDDTLNEVEELGKIAEDLLKLHDKLLKMGFKEFAEDELKIHDTLLGIKERKTKPDTGKQTSLFLRDEKGHIYGEIGVTKEVSQKELLKNEPVRGKLSKEDVQKDKESYRLFLQNIRNFIGLWLDENLIPTFIDGSVKEITGYSREDFHSMKLKWIELVYT